MSKEGIPQKQKYEYKTDWPIFCVNWSERADKPFRVAISSFKEEYSNSFQICRLNVDEDVIEKVSEMPHPYPVTNLQFLPKPSVQDLDLVASSGDFLRIYEIDKEDNSVKTRALLDKNRKSEFCAPVTSFDWSCADKTVLGTASIDTTCTIWDVEKLVPTRHLIAHDKECFDISFSHFDASTFASCSRDKSVRFFDLRALDHSTMLFEAAAPVLRVQWNRANPNYIGALVNESAKMVILDIRFPVVPVMELFGHSGAINSFCWAPHAASLLATGSEDMHDFIWDVSSLAKTVEKPMLAYKTLSEVNYIDWSRTEVDWIASTAADRLEFLHV
eukprot:gnl/Chilomastix_cuspidata/2507.p1 GENE.gnl/Chilomastix_cuspidata/2507~~gnl/Chilomastix_cuspidata/2507.p1  ORF type:complete len:331 (+),score=155.58 gnl/Chilomastix_cuspidata/2507:37-1029(+)